MKRDQEAGFSLLEVVIVMGIMGAMALAFMSMQSSQIKANNFLLYQVRRTEIKGAILGQFLNDPANCGCLFRNAGAAPFPAAASGVTLSTATVPDRIGRYQFVTPGNCATASVPLPFVSNDGIDGVKSTSIGLTNITNISGQYSGVLTVRVESLRDVQGPTSLPISFPVNISTTPSTPGNVDFVSCSASAGAMTAGLDYSPMFAGAWANVVTANAGGSGYLGTSPYFAIGAVQVSGCGPIVTVTVADPAVTTATRAALIGFYNANANDSATLGRVYSTANIFQGGFGQAGRGGDGASSGSASEMMVALTNRQFRMQTCRRGGGTSVTSYKIKAVLE